MAQALWSIGFFALALLAVWAGIGALVYYVGSLRSWRALRDAAATRDAQGAGGAAGTSPRVARRPGVYDWQRGGDSL